jgi:hypothetical protein
MHPDGLCASGGALNHISNSNDGLIDGGPYQTAIDSCWLDLLPLRMVQWFYIRIID